MGELLGISRWRARFQGVGLDEKLMHNATEKVGTLLVQVERFMRVLSTVLQQVCPMEDEFLLWFSFECKFCCEPKPPPQQPTEIGFFLSFNREAN